MKTIAALTLSLLAAPAFAAEPPTSLTPTSDTAVTYSMEMPGQPPTSMVVAWNVSAGKVRFDPTGAPSWMLSDLRQNTTVMVMESQRTYMNLPAGAAMQAQPRLPPGAQLTAAGTDTVAGHACNLWKYTTTQPVQAEGTLCVTSDNLLLRMQTRLASGQEVKMEATNVSIGPQDASRFTVPEGYRQMEVPQAPQAPQQRR
jgi:outer membrane lipoprotein-sorting protein